jgi:nitrite reductase (NO-forming)
MKKMQLFVCLLGMLSLAACSGGGNTENAENTSTPPPQSMVQEETPSAEDVMAEGKSIYARTCQACHQENGQGVAKTFPPLANSDLLNADVDGAIRGVIFGRKGEITVNGEKYNLEMAPVALNDKEVASVLTYVYGSWDNTKTEVTPEMVAAVRSKGQ